MKHLNQKENLLVAANKSLVVDTNKSLVAATRRVAATRHVVIVIVAQRANINAIPRFLFIVQ
jgi:hypothetical protein